MQSPSPLFSHFVRNQQTCLSTPSRAASRQTELGERCKTPSLGRLGVATENARSLGDPSSICIFAITPSLRSRSLTRHMRHFRPNNSSSPSLCLQNAVLSSSWERIKNKGLLDTISKRRHQLFLRELLRLSSSNSLLCSHVAKREMAGWVGDSHDLAAMQ